MNCCDVFSQEHIRTPLTTSGSSKVLTKDDWRLQLLFEGVIYQKPERAVNHLETDCMKVQFILTLTDLRWGCFSWWKPDNWLFGGEMSWNISSRVKKPSINPRFLQSLSFLLHSEMNDFFLFLFSLPLVLPSLIPSSLLRLFVLLLAWCFLISCLCHRFLLVLSSSFTLVLSPFLSFLYFLLLFYVLSYFHCFIEVVC